MSQNMEEKVSFDGSKVKVLGAEYEPGEPVTFMPGRDAEKFDWRAELKNRDEMLAYLRVGVR